MTRYWQTDPLDPNPTPRHWEEGEKKKKTRLSLSNGAISCIRNREPWDRHTQDGHTHKTYTGTIILYAQSKIDEYQRDRAGISVWIPHALRLSEEKGRRSEGNIAEGRRTEQREEFWSKKEVSFLTLNVLRSLSQQEEFEARVCSSKRICMAGWTLLWKQYGCKIFISTGSLPFSPWPDGWSSVYFTYSTFSLNEHPPLPPDPFFLSNDL